MKTLLDKAREAKGIKKEVPVINEEYELGIAWAKGELSLRQIQKALRYENVNSSYVFLSRCFKRSISKTNKK